MTLLDERHSDALTVQKLSIERIAREAGVSKTTIYRWWPSKAALIIDTFLDNHVAKTPVRDDVSALEALREHLSSLADIYSGPEGRLVAQLLAECQYDPETMAEFKKRFWLPRSQAVNSLIERAVEEGTIRSGLEPELIAELLYAPLYFRLLFQIEPLNADIAKTFLTAGLDGIAQTADPA